MTQPTSKRLIDELVRESGAGSPEEAIRRRAIQAIDAFVDALGEPDPFPLDLSQLASFLGIKQSDATPAFSPDAELVPDGSGGVEMRVNPDRPETRRRFSIGHEITHTFFPDHKSHTWPRADARYRDLRNPDDQLERLCDVGAAELVFPRRWFSNDALGVRCASDLVKLAERYKASREATVRRFAERHPGAVAAVFLIWKLKPSQKQRLVPGEKPNLLGMSPDEERMDALKLRINYAISSQDLAARGYFFPRDKSVASNGAIYDAARLGEPTDEESFVEIGSVSGRCRIHAIPLWTPAESRGPRLEHAVAAIITPLEVREGGKKPKAVGPSLFG